MEKNKNHYAIIMAGGIGSRFWPYSRTQRPKQFLDILGVGSTLLQSTYNRFLKHFEKENIYIVTNQSYLPMVMEQIPGINPNCVLGEPSAKNTAACIAYAGAKIHQLNTHALCVVAPSDHLILDEANFIDKLVFGLNYAKNNQALVTLGIRPSRPDTGYGYIQYIDEREQDGLFRVKTFTEKPSLELAQTFIDSGDFLWNAGIFIWSSSSIRKAFKELMPEHYELFDNASKSFGTTNEQAAIQSVYEQCRSISIDYGILEKADNVYVIPSDFGWSDLGTWTSLYENFKQKDEFNNAIHGKNIHVYNTSNCMISSNAGKGKVVVLNSVKDIIVVDTEDVLMICDKNKEQEVKQMVADMKIKYDEKYT
ncbi:MAG: NTP transferase domain-containing protein [Bacteroidia bacterium]|nr:NTP transferase domain-containing protein [Bacteroidia bacterium]MBP9688034.1 NTP transferase domain-containing protein [Bacteroidia bacterium]